MTKTIEDEAALIAELNAVFPRSDARSLREWRNRSTSIGAVVCGEAKIGGEEIGPTVVADHETYNGWVHKAFEAWCEDRGWYVEVYEPGTLWVVPLPGDSEDVPSTSNTQSCDPVSPWMAGVQSPCDPNILRRAIEVWQAGAQVPLRKRPVSGPGYVLADIPINRAAIATAGFLRARNVKNAHAYLWRAMNFGEVLEQALPGGPLARFVTPSDKEGVVFVSDALFHAVALARAPVSTGGDIDALAHGPSLDLQAIQRLAEQYESDRGADAKGGANAG